MLLGRNLAGIHDLGVLLGRNRPGFSIWACCSEETGRNSRFGRVSRKKQAVIPDLGVFLGRNRPEFSIWACFSEETGRNSRFGRVARKKQAGIPDLGVLLGRNRPDFPIWACYLEETGRNSRLRHIPPEETGRNSGLRHVSGWKCVRDESKTSCRQGISPPPAGRFICNPCASYTLRPTM